MNIISQLRDKKWLAMVLVFLAGAGPLASATAGDLMSAICRGEVVSVGDRSVVHRYPNRRRP
jgi:hypothetical protein